MANLAQLVPLFVSAVSQVGAFEAGQTVTLQIPEETTTINVPDIGAVKVTESGGSVSFTKMQATAARVPE